MQLIDLFGTAHILISGYVSNTFPATSADSILLSQSQAGFNKAILFCYLRTVIPEVQYNLYIVFHVQFF